MQVRWKPLLILSGLFAATALMGLGVWVFGFGAGAGDDPETILEQARAEREAGQYDRALIQYRRALQAAGGADASIHEEIAALSADALKTAADDQKTELQINRIRSLAEAARLDRRRVEPRRTLMREALADGEEADALRWAEELIALDPADADAHYLHAEKFLDRNAQDLNKARTHIEALAKLQPESWRVALTSAKLNLESNQPEKNSETMTRAIGTATDADMPAAERVALVRLKLIAFENDSTDKSITQRIESLRKDLEPVLTRPETAVSHRVEWTRSLQKAARDLPGDAESKTVAERVSALLESSLKLAIEKNRNDLRLQLALAQQLIASGRYAACVELVDNALKSPEAKQPGAQPFVYGLRDLAIKSLLADTADKDRFDKAAPHIQALLAAKPADVQGLGHLFQGAIDLERSGVGENVAVVAAPQPDQQGVKTKADVPKTADDYRRNAQTHLRKAAEALPDLAMAQALYGVSLILGREPDLGRQALQKAWVLGIKEVRYQVWMAWSQIIAGYPEDALPIVTDLMTRAETDATVAIFRPTLHLLMGEIHQARNTPESLRLAYEQYAKALATGKDVSSTVHLRVAQLEMLLQQSDRADKRLSALAKNQSTAAAATHLQILGLIDKGNIDAARKMLSDARSNHPESPELVIADATMMMREGKHEDAVATLGTFLKNRPEMVEVIQLQAQILAERLGRTEEARKLIAEHLAKAPNSAIQAQSAQLAILARDFGSAQQAIARLRTQWPDAASADMLAAQLNLAQDNLPGALASFKEALKKDPSNKVARFWAAMMESRLGAVASATQTLQELAAEAPTKRLDFGVSLKTASEAHLASLEIDSGQADAAIARLDRIIREAKTTDVVRDAKWQIVAALASKRDWSRMDALIAELAGDANASVDDRVRAANYLRAAGLEDKAMVHVDAVIRTQPSHPGAAALKGFVLANRKKFDEAAAAISLAIDDPAAPVSLSLLLAAIENGRDPIETRMNRSMAVLEKAFAKNPTSVDLIKAIYTMRRGSESKESMIAWLDSVVSEKATPACKRLKAQILVSEGEFVKADAIFSDLIQLNGADLSLALERLTAMRTHIAQANESDRDAIRTLNGELDQLIVAYRGKFAQNPEIYAFEAELAAERGQADRALEISKKIDAMNPTSPLGPLVRVRVLTPRRQWSEVIKNLEDALARDPRRRDLRIQLATIYAEQGQSDEAVRSVDQVLALDPEQVQATLLKARLMVRGDEKSQSAQALEAIKLLEKLVAAKPDEQEIYEQAAGLALLADQPTLATEWIKRGLARKSDDPALVSMLIETAAAGPEGDKTIAEWKSKAAADATGRLALAISVALQRSGRLKEALELGDLAIAKADMPGAWLNKGGILLALAESSPEPQRKALFEESIKSYDKVLAANADAIEAVNNKAWILHHHLQRHQSAAEVVDAFLKRTDPSRVPAEFDDTVGAIREAVAQNREAESAYLSGLAKSPAHPMLNFHLGRLLSRDPGRKSNSRPYLERALADSDRLGDSEAAEAKKILSELDGKSSETIRTN